MKHIETEKLIKSVNRYRDDAKAAFNPIEDDADYYKGKIDACEDIQELITALQQERPEENKLPDKRARVNYAICKLQSFKPLRETIVLDDYVYDEGKCYRENLLNYIHAIPENRLTEIRRYLKENGWWPYDDDDTDWMKQEQPEVDLEKLKNKAELIANEIMIGVQANKYHTCIYNTASNDFNHSHLVRAALKGIEFGLKASKED